MTLKTRQSKVRTLAREIKSSNYNNTMRPSISCLLVFAFSKIAYASYNTSYNTTTPICTTLSYAFPNDTYFPESNIYNASISSYPFVQLRLHPTCILRPKTSRDVSAAIKILGKADSKFAVRGGGHNANRGFNNINDGVTIDMRSLNAVYVDRNVARVDAGAVWQEVYDAVEPYNLTVLGGRIGVVGVAGLTTGGMSYFCPKHRAQPVLLYTSCRTLTIDCTRRHLILLSRTWLGMRWSRKF